MDNLALSFQQLADRKDSRQSVLVFDHRGSPPTGASC